MHFVFCGLYRSVENYLSESSLQGIGPARQPAALDLEAANCLILRSCFRRSVVASWISGARGDQLEFDAYLIGKALTGSGGVRRALVLAE